MPLVSCEGNRVIERHDRYISFKNLEISPYIEHLTGFSWDYYDKVKESPVKVWGDFKKYLYDPQYKVIGQNLLGLILILILLRPLQFPTLSVSVLLKIQILAQFTLVFLLQSVLQAQIMF